MEQIQIIWDYFVEHMKNKQGINANAIQTWILPAKPIKLEGNVLTIATPTDVHKDYWERHYLSDLTLAGYGSVGVDINPVIITEQNVEAVDYSNTVNSTPLQTVTTVEHTVQPEFTSLSSQIHTSKLNERYTFENFVAGNSNQTAHAAALSVAEKPGQTYNPLFIYGGVGLGKTHLMQAIGHDILRRDPQAKVHFVTAENFINEFVDAMGSSTTDEFKSFYRNLDLLMIDDVQFMAKKDTFTEQEFFHTFEALITQGKAIVMTSDRLPQSLKNFTDRNISRFQRGLVIDVAPAEYETRLAILRNKTKTEGLEEIFSDKMLQLIASRITSHIRELEGAFTAVYAQSVAKNVEITRDFIEEVIANLNGEASTYSNEVTIQSIQEAVSEFYDMTVKDLKGKKRAKPVTTARQIAMFLSRELTKESLPKIGQEFGGKDHTSVMYAHKNIQERILNDERFRNEIQSIKRSI